MPTRAALLLRGGEPIVVALSADGSFKLEAPAKALASAREMRPVFAVKSRGGRYSLSRSWNGATIPLSADGVPVSIGFSWESDTSPYTFGLLKAGTIEFRERFLRTTIFDTGAGNETNFLLARADKALDLGNLTPDGENWKPQVNPLADQDTDGDGTNDAVDLDDDNDEVADATEEPEFAYDAGDNADLDDDGIGDNSDPDDDGDGQPDTVDSDDDGDGIQDAVDTDDDGDGLDDSNGDSPVEDQDGDADEDGQIDASDADDDGDGEADEVDMDDDGDGVGDEDDMDDEESTTDD